MTHKQAHEASEGVARRGLARCHGKRVAVALDHPVRRHVLVHGQAVYEQDPLLGRVLRIELDASGGSSTALLVAERHFRGPLYSGRRFGCDYLLDLRMPRESAQSRSEAT